MEGGVEGIVGKGQLRTNELVFKTFTALAVTKETDVPKTCKTGKHKLF